MSRRDKKLERMLADLQAGKAGAADPFEGIPPALEQAFLYAAGSPAKEAWGFDGWNSAARVHVHRDGYSSAHVGACSVASPPDPRETLVHQAGLDRDEADVWRALCASPTAGSDTLARHLGMALRTFQRRFVRVRGKLAALRVELDLARWAP